jgi:hypothetical protein
VQRQRPRVADVGAHAAAGAAVRAHAVGLRLDPNDIVRTDASARIAAAATVRVDRRRMQAESAALFASGAGATWLV